MTSHIKSAFYSSSSKKKRRMTDFTESDSPVWILGLKYTPNPPKPTMYSSSSSSLDSMESSSPTLKPSSSLSSLLWRYTLGTSPTSTITTTTTTTTNTSTTMEEQELQDRKQQQQEQEELSFYYKIQKDALMSDFYTRMWFTYRKDFPPIVQHSTLTLKKMFSRQISPISASIATSTTDHHQPTTTSSSNSQQSTSTIYYTTSNAMHSPRNHHSHVNDHQQHIATTTNTQQSEKSTMTKLYHQISCYTSDSGWGCMMRTGQMMLAQAFMHYYCGRDYRVHEQGVTEQYKTILQWFADDEQAPYSIHRITLAGTLYGKKIGEWFGPSTICLVIKKLVEAYHGDNFTVYVADQGGLYIDEIMQQCTDQTEQIVNHKMKEVQELLVNWENGINSGKNTSDLVDDENNNNNNNNNNNSSTTPSKKRLKKQKTHTNEEKEDFWRPVIILVPLRLGLDCLNPIYEGALKKVIEAPQSLGVIGGKPKSSLYFVGYQDSNLIYLDPHTVQKKSHKVNTYHCKSPLKLGMDAVDPSLALGFFCKDRAEFEEFCGTIREIAAMKNPIISVSYQRPNYSSKSTPIPTTSRTAPKSTSNATSNNSSNSSNSSNSDKDNNDNCVHYHTFTSSDDFDIIHVEEQPDEFDSQAIDPLDENACIRSSSSSNNITAGSSHGTITASDDDDEFEDDEFEII